LTPGLGKKNTTVKTENMFRREEKLRRVFDLE